MSLVGAFPGWEQMRRHTRRAPVNPLDKSTIISVYPIQIEEKKPTLQPNRWIIPPGTKERPSCTLITPASWWKEVDEKQPFLEIPVASIVIADSIVKDYCNGLLNADQSKMPGLFFVPGEINELKARTEYADQIEEADRKQRLWYQELIKVADISWSRTNGNPLTINEMMKAAAHALGIEDREWLKTYKAAELVRCFACGTMKNPAYPVCPSCRAIDPEHPKAKFIKFAQ